MSISQFPMKPPVTAIAGIWKFERKKGSVSRAYSTPGHLLHLVLKGAHTLKMNGREYSVNPGDVIYYHECEEVEAYRDKSDVVFYSVSFASDALEPLPHSHRVFKAGPSIKKAFDKLYKAFITGNGTEFDIYIHLMEIISNIKEFQLKNNEGDEEKELWWRIENEIRRKRNFTVSVKELADSLGKSRSSIVRACRKASGKSPLRRIREIRMAEANSLLVYSTLNVSQTAESLGYPRMHEFSREFAKYYGFPPQVVIAKRKTGRYQSSNGEASSERTFPKKTR